MEKPIDPSGTERLYKIMASTKKEFVYEIIIEMPKWPIIDDAYIFFGAVKNAEGFQINPNGKVVELLRERIENNKIKRFPLGSDNKFDYGKGEIYSFIK